MGQVFTLSAGDVKLVLAPERGGAIARLDLNEKPILRPWGGNKIDSPWSLASNILAPFSNRVSGKGFRFADRFHPLLPNFEGEPYPIHGDGFQKPWQRTGEGTLTLRNGQIGPYFYRATQEFDLQSDGMRITLNIKNTGDVTLPFGGGFHPWFPRDRHTRLSFNADAVWMESEEHLPTTLLALQDNPDWSFSTSRPIPAAGLNNCWVGWTGAACLEQGPDFVSVKISGSANLTYAIVHTIPNRNFICFEPVSHPVNAHNMEGFDGLRLLAPGQSLELVMEFEW